MSLSRQALLSMVSHDVRNPLSAILMNASHLLHTWPEDERRPRARRQMEIIRHEAERLDDLMFDFIDALSLEAGSLCLALADCALDPPIVRAIERSQPVLVPKALQVSPPVGKLPLLRCDGDRMARVFGHLIRRSAALAPRAITVAAERVVKEVRVSIALTDAAIPDGDAQGESGLGLYVSKGIIEAHGGRFWVEEGSRFCFTLPSPD